MWCSILCIWTALISFVCAQDQFTSPKGGGGSWWTQKWANGDTMNITWQGAWKGPNDSPGQADLWITWFESDAFSQLIKADIKMGNPGHLDWKIDVPRSTINTDSRFLLKFLPHVNPTVYRPTDNHASSVGFDIIIDTSRTTSQSQSSSATSTTFSTSTVSPTTSSPPASSTPADALNKPEQKDKKKTNIGAIAGGILGGLIFLIMLLVIALLVLRLKKRKNAEKHYELSAGKAPMSPSNKQGEYAYVHNAPASEAEAAPVELPDTHRMHELGSGPGVRG